MEYKVPQYLHRPVMVLWFEGDEMVTVVIGFLIGFFMNGWWWLALVIVPYIYIIMKRRNPRGYLRHIQYQLGLMKFKGYPHYYQSRFWE